MGIMVCSLLWGNAGFISSTICQHEVSGKGCPAGLRVQETKGFQGLGFRVQGWGFRV